MITLQAVCQTIPGLTEGELRAWLAQDWVRPEQRGGELLFREIDVARVRLIRDLSLQMEVESATVPLILSLLDQLYATRRQLRLLLNALDEPARDTLARQLAPDLLPVRPADE
jgi:chaperone modulatory protein CbpM